MLVKIEYTDTFNGEANYSWVKRRTMRLDGSLSDRQVFIRAKKMMGLYGVRGSKLDTGDCISFRPHNSNTVMYITYDEEEPKPTTGFIVKGIMTGGYLVYRTDCGEWTPDRSKAWLMSRNTAEVVIENQNWRNQHQQHIYDPVNCMKVEEVK